MPKQVKQVSINRYAIVDKETGEIIADDAMFIGKKAYVDKGWRKVFVGFLHDIVTNPKIAGKAIRLLLWMIENLRMNDLTIYMSERVVCEDIGITRATYYIWVRTLIDEGLIEKVDTNLYRLVPYSRESGSKTAVNGQMKEAIKKIAKA
jgi:hypothetical protein